MGIDIHRLHTRIGSQSRRDYRVEPAARWRLDLAEFSSFACKSQLGLLGNDQPVPTILFAPFPVV